MIRRLFCVLMVSLLMQSVAAKTCTGKEMSIQFHDMPVQTTLSVIATFSGNKLQLDPPVSGSGAFNYQCVGWDVILQDVANRYRLTANVRNGVIIVGPRR